MRTSLPNSIYVNWDMTYACPLRCSQCYSESGRRPSRQLGLDDQLALADQIIKMNPQSVQFSGGEPLTNPSLLEVAKHFVTRGVPVYLYTSGWGLDESTAQQITQLFSKIHISVDGAEAKLHDRLRGKTGSFNMAMRALSLFNQISYERIQQSEAPVHFGIDCTVSRSNFPHLEDFCTHILPQFPEIRFIDFGAVIPSGLASRQEYAEQELLTIEQMEKMSCAFFASHLRALAPAGVKLNLTDNLMLQMHPDDLQQGKAAEKIIQIEPDGHVRGMAIYEGTVGNLLEELVETLLEKVWERPYHPFVVEKLLAVRNNQDWAAATRAIDWYFGTKADQARISKRSAALSSVSAAKPR